ncbi:hypothetical protein [Sulfurospirillum arcachonense]|uniref:hypothetical protein n=1 Tax=Sulfurospirillum arcachonense TaxID=57666 RepID=UPI000469383E|nr:hypothetical protein [Sulfurospirillum arcachonense]
MEREVMHRVQGEEPRKFTTNRVAITCKMLFSMFFLSSLVMPQCANAKDNEGYDFYVKPSASYYSIKLPDYAPMALRLTGAIGSGFLHYLPTIGNKDNSILSEFTIGIEEKKKKIFYEIKGFDHSSSSNGNNIFDYSTDYRVGYFPIDGSTSSIGLGLGDDFVVSTSRDFEHKGLELISGIPYEVNKNTTFYTLIGYSHISIDQSFTTHAYELQTPSNTMDLDESIKGTYHGATIGFKLESLQKSYSTYFTGTYSRYRASLKYTGKQKDTIVVPMDIDRELSKSKWVKQVKLEAGISKKISKKWTLDLTAGLSFLDVPQITASTKSSAFNEGEPNSIGFDKSRSVKFGVGVTYRF